MKRYARYYLCRTAKWLAKVGIIKKGTYAKFENLLFYGRYTQNKHILHNISLRKIQDKCNFCGSKENLTIDHKIPTSKGGANNLKNKQILCARCNQRKADKILK